MEDANPNKHARRGGHKSKQDFALFSPQAILLATPNYNLHRSRNGTKFALVLLFKIEGVSKRVYHQVTTNGILSSDSTKPTDPTRIFPLLCDELCDEGLVLVVRNVG